MERRKYPIKAEDYELFEVVGDGATASVHRARCLPFNEIVAIKILDLERSGVDLKNITREAQTMTLIDHPNILTAHCSFVNDHMLWVVMPYMAGGSLFHIMKAAYPKGFEEAVIATVLRETLKGIEYLHNHGHIHRDVKAGNILIDGRGGVKIGDFGVSACLFDSGDRQRLRNTFVGTPCWMAPEVMERKGYDLKADIWSFGITALELAHGHAPFSSRSPVQVFTLTLLHPPPCLESKGDKKFSKSFKHMIAMCLVKDPSKRPSAQKLLKQSFFKQARSQDYIVRKILEGLPSLGDRIQLLKQKEAELCAQKKMLYGEREEKSQNEYNRGISNWNFDMEDLKAQASLIPDDEDAVPGGKPNRCSNTLFELDPLQENTPRGMFSDASSSGELESDRVVQTEASLQSLPNPSTKYQRVGSDVSEREFIFSGSSDHNVLKNGQILRVDANEAPISATQHNELQKRRNLSGLTSDAVNDLPLEAMPKASKLTASTSADDDEKLKPPFVQQKGRFKVTSQNVDLDKALPSPGLQKSCSLQDNILDLMKQRSHAEPSASTTESPEPYIEPLKREKELIKNISDLQQRLSLAQEELQKLQTKNVEV